MFGRKKKALQRKMLMDALVHLANAATVTDEDCPHTRHLHLASVGELVAMSLALADPPLELIPELVKIQTECAQVRVKAELHIVTEHMEEGSIAETIPDFMPDQKGDI